MWRLFRRAAAFWQPGLDASPICHSPIPNLTGQGSKGRLKRSGNELGRRVEVIRPKTATVSSRREVDYDEFHRASAGDR